MSPHCAILIGLVFAMVGCTPGAYVTKNPTAKDKGIRYYRPKPYLFISPVNTGTIASTTGADGKTQAVVKADGVSDRFVQIQLQYLPDFAEEYSIRVRPGIGSATVNIQLENGWNLTKVDQILDSQLDDNIKAIGELIGNVSKFAGTSTGQGEGSQMRPTVVCATNVPLGYYESVIGTGPNGCKQLFGWRYVGFLPYNQCPVQAMGGEAWCCNQSGPLYGLVFTEGVMTFRQLGEISCGPNLQRVVDPGQVTIAGPKGEKTVSDAQFSNFKAALETKFNADPKIKLTITLADNKIDVSVMLTAPPAEHPALIQLVQTQADNAAKNNKIDSDLYEVSQSSTAAAPVEGAFYPPRLLQ